jgi:hypothetical protein
MWVVLQEYPNTGCGVVKKNLQVRLDDLLHYCTTNAFIS